MNSLSQCSVPTCPTRTVVPGQSPVLQLWLCVCWLLQLDPGAAAADHLKRCLTPPLQGSAQAVHTLHALHTHQSMNDTSGVTPGTAALHWEYWEFGNAETIGNIRRGK